MISAAVFHSAAPVASKIASSNDSGGSSPWIIIVLLAIAAIWLVSVLGGGSEPTVVVVQRSPGAFLGWGVIALAIVIIYFVYIGPGSGPI